MFYARRDILKKLLKRYFIDALGSMAVGLFSSLIIGVIIKQISTIEVFSYLKSVTEFLEPTSPVIGSVIGVSISYGLKSKPLAMFSSGIVGAIGYIAGGPVGSFIGVIIGAEIGSFISGKTPIDIILVPFITISTGGLVANFTGPYIKDFMDILGNVITKSTDMQPLLMGIIISVIVGIALTLPISSAALCIMLGLGGIAGGAAVAGCSAQMIGFAVISFSDNGIEGLMSQGLGTSMLQITNIMRKPIVWLAPIVASVVTGALSTTVFHMQASPTGAGMGTSGFVGQISTYSVMSAYESPMIVIIKIILLHFIIPAAVALLVDFMLRRAGIVKKGDMKIKV